MSNTIASLAVNVVANTAPFAKGMKTTRSEVKLLEASVGTLKNAMLGLGAGLLAGFSVRELKSTADEMDRITKTARRLDVTTGALSGLGHAAELSGVSMETLTKGLTFLERNLGSGSANRAFEKLGLNVETLKRMKADLALEQIANAMNKLPTAADKTATAMDIFGKSGADLIPLLAEGSEGIRKMREEAERLGITFDETAGKKAEAMNDALTKMKGAFEGLKREAVATGGGFVAQQLEGYSTMIQADRRFLFGTEKGPRQAAADKYIGSMSDQQFGDWTRANPLGGLDEFLRNAAGSRMDKFMAQPGNGIVPMGGDLLGMQTLAMMNFGMAAMQKFPSSFSLPEMSPAEMHKISNAVAEMTASNDLVTPAAGGGHRLAAALGTFGQEAGSAEAFRQERRTALAAGGNDVQAKQLEEQKKQTAALHKIDTNTSKADALEVINIA